MSSRCRTHSGYLHSTSPVLFWFVAVFCVLIVFSLASGTALAQSPVAPLAQVEPPTVEAAAPKDPLGRETPEGFVLGLLKAMADEDYARAAGYLNLNKIPRSRRDEQGPELARELQQLLDKGGWVAANWQLSKDPAGQQNDGLPPDREQFATVRTPEGTVGLVAERVDNPETGKIWLVSSETITQVPDLLNQMEDGLIDRLLPESLAGGPRLGGVPFGHWAALLVLAVVAYLGAWVLTAILVFAIHQIWRRSRVERAARLIDAAVLPFRIYLAVWIFAIGTIFLGVSVIARQQFGYFAEIVAWVAIAWFLWRVVDALAEVSMERMSRHSRLGALSAVRFFRRSAKFVIVAVGSIAALDSFGFDVTTGIAALGIGGIAIALGAQKTVENLVGSLTLIADQPVRVGDFCRFGQTLGTVEDIGMRSTRIRTLDRTIVTIPNGEFSSLQIENYSHRDRFRFQPTLGLCYETTTDQIRYLLVTLREMLYAHPRVNNDPARVRFLGLGADCLNVEIFAYVHAADYNEFLEVQEDLTLRIMDIVAESGASFAFPSQTLYMAKDALPEDDKRIAAEAHVRAWSESGELRLPRFRPDQIDAVKDTLAYPPEGSALHNRNTPTRSDQPPQESDLKIPPPKGFWPWRRQ